MIHKSEAMSRWEGLKSDSGDQRGKRRNDSGLRRSNNRWVPKTAAANAKTIPATREGSRQHYNKKHISNNNNNNNNKASFRGRPGGLTTVEAETNEELTALIAEHDAILNSLQSKLIGCQANGDESQVINHLTKLLRNTTNISQLQKADEIPRNTDVFMGLTGLLERKAEKELIVSVAKTIESYWKVSEMGGKNNPLLKIVLSKSQVQLGINVLSSHYHTADSSSPAADSLLVSIALMTKNYVSDLPPESTAQHVVGAIFIPFLKQSQTVHLVTMKYVCEAIVALLRNPSHASAILASLVADVSKYGIEEETINPLKMELLGVLLDYLELPLQEPTEKLAHVCKTLSAAMDAIRKLKGNEHDTAVRNAADVPIIQRLQTFILKVLSENNRKRKQPSLQNRMVSILQLLRSFIACYPKAMTAIGWKLIIEGANRNGNSNKFHTIGSSDSTTQGTYLPLLLVVDKLPDTTIQQTSKGMSLAMDCITDLIMVLPWNKWLTQSDNTTARNRVMTPMRAPRSGLYNTVVDALVALIGITKKVFCNCNDKSQMNSLGRLMKSIMVEIPFCDTKLICAGESLWSEITIVILKHNNIRQNLACDVLVAASGGTTTPQGFMRPMSPPAQSWFRSKDSKQFLDLLLNSFAFIDSRYDQTVKILSHILRTLPDVGVERWDILCGIFQELNPNSNRKELMRMEVLESFMLGRKNFEVSAHLISKSDQMIKDLDGVLLQGWNLNSLQRCMNIYSAVSSRDWSLLDQTHHKSSSHLDNILSCCENSSAKIREGAARAVGEFCSQYFASNDSSDSTMQQYHLLAPKVLAAMIKLCEDKNAGVRAMAIFSLGNLSAELKSLKGREIIETSHLYQMHKATISSFSDANDKVVKNAIRSIGHTSNLLALSLQREPSATQILMSCGLLVETIELLTSKLWKTLHVALNEEEKATMTWKERSVAKKHGWGACHSLGLVFEGLWLSLLKDCGELGTACANAALCLARCPCHYNVLNEKVVLAAIAALCDLPSEFLSEIERDEPILGNVLQTSILILESGASNQQISQKLVRQNEPFLLHLLNSASIADATTVLEHDRITPKTLEFLYSWMVDVHRFDYFSARAFQVFALALQQSGRWSDSVAFEQKFTSRALQKRKKEWTGRFDLVLNSTEENINEDDGADEL